VIDGIQTRQRRVIDGKAIDLVVEVNIMLARVGKGFMFDFVQHIGQDFIDCLAPQKTLERKHAVTLEIVHALPEQLLPDITVEPV